MRILFIMISFLLSCQSFAQVQQFTLHNGLKVIVKEDHRAPVAIAMVWYKVGSADEPLGITGVSHALEHLMFKGTKRYPAGVFSKKVASLGGQYNAFTNNDYTAYFEKTASEHLEMLLKLDADRMKHLLLDKQAFAKEIKVIQEERRLRTDNNPQALAFERFLAAAHLAAPYHHPVIGWMSDLKQMTVADAKAWYRRYYVPNNATLVVVGNVNPKTVHRLAETYFGSLAKRSLPERKSQTEPPHLGPKKLIVHAPAQIPLLILGYTVPTVPSASKKHAMDPYALEIIAALLDAGDSGRFSQELVRKQQIASNTDVFYNMYARYQSQFVIYGVPTQTHTIKALKQAIVSELQRLKTELVSPRELERVKTQIIAEKTFERDSIFGQAMELGLLETIGLGWVTSEKYVERIQSVTALQVQEVAQRYFQVNRETEAVLLPQPSASKRPHSHHGEKL